jgi:ABC-type multidrug transport system fused ATPase/permease subunit
MITSYKKLYRDVLYVSKITKTNNKRLIIFSAVILAQLTALSDILLILFFTSIITGVINVGNVFLPIVQFIQEFTFLLPFIVILRFACIYFQSIVLKKLELDVQENLRVYLLNEVFEKRNYSIADAYFFINELASHISFFYSNLAGFMNSLLQMFAYLIYLILADTRTIFTFGIGAVIIFFPTKFLITKAREFMHKSYTYSKETNYEVQRIIENMFLIKILKKDQEEIRNFKNTLGNYNLSTLKNHKYGAINSFLPSLITMFIFSILLVFSSLAKSITLDFIAVTLRLFQSIGIFNSSMNKIINSHVHIEKFYELDENKLLINKNNFKFLNKENKNVIEISNLSFKYFNSEDYIFENLDLSIPVNQHTILTGPNGSGKSTLLGLISGVLYSEKGNVITYKDKFGYIGAIPLIFTGTLKQNLMYGNDEIISDEKIMELLKEFDVFKEKRNYDLTREISNKSLSSGQMQKISFIRALLANTEVLLLDESTANLDEKSRDLIFDILKNQNISIINSTHDPTSFKDVENHIKIVIEEDKRIILPD